MEKQINKIKGFELVSSNHYISDSGEVISYRWGKRRVLKPAITKKGYLRLSLYQKELKKGKPITIHRLVALAFIPNPDNKEQVNHKDGNKTNNDISNLEWVTNKENMTHAWETNLRDNGWDKGKNNYQWDGNHKNCKEVIQRDLEGNIINTYKSIAIASRETGLGVNGIGKTCRKETKSNHYKGYIWEFKK